jgi:plastocyanin
MFRKAAITAVAVISLVFVAVATATTVTVSITKNGYVPNAVSIATSDSVQFTNSDTVAHQIVFKSATGITCAPNPFVLQPGQSGTCRFASAGSFSYSDPNVKGNTYRGSVTVAGVADSLTVAAKPQVIVFGGKVTLSGTLSNQKVGENVDVLATACGQNASSKATTVQTITAGAYTAAVVPLQNTVYTVKVKSTSSRSVSVKVKPRLRLSKIAAHRYSVRVSAAQSLAGKYGTFQRFNGTLHRWVSIKRVLLRANATGVAPTVISSAGFRSAIKSGARVRVILPQLQVGSCYQPGLSNTIYS